MKILAVQIPLLILLLISVATVYAEISIRSIDIDTPLDVYGYENHTYRDTIINVSILIYNNGDRPIYNVTVADIVGARLLRCDTIDKLDPYREATLKASIEIPSNASLEPNNIVLVISYTLANTTHYINTSFTIVTVPRNITRVGLWLDPENNSVCIRNPARLGDVGQLVIYNATLRIYNITETLENILIRTFSIPKLSANQTMCFSIPWNLSRWPFVNVTITVCDDVHGCRVVNSTWIPPIFPKVCSIVVRVTDDWGNPIEGAIVRLGNATAVTDENGVAVLESTAIGDATVLYQDKKVTIYILGCGNYTAVIDTHPPKLLYHDVGEGFVKIRFEDYSSVYVVVDNGAKHGPYRDVAILWISGKHRLCLVDEYNNSGPCIDVDVPRPREPPYVLIALLALVLGAVLYAGFTLLSRFAME